MTIATIVSSGLHRWFGNRCFVFDRRRSYKKVGTRFQLLHGCKFLAEPDFHPENIVHSWLWQNHCPEVSVESPVGGAGLHIGFRSFLYSLSCLFQPFIIIDFCSFHHTFIRLGTVITPRYRWFDLDPSLPLTSFSTKVLLSMKSTTSFDSISTYTINGLLKITSIPPTFSCTPCGTVAVRPTHLIPKPLMTEPKTTGN